MSTSGLWGLRKDGVDKFTYSWSNSGPEVLGAAIVDFCANSSIENLKKFYDDIQFAESSDEISNIKEGEITTCFDKANDFIKDSLFCEHAYIVNLDSNKLEYWSGFQHKPDPDNRYGQELYNSSDNEDLAPEDSYYPCKLESEFSLDELQKGELLPEQVVNRMLNLEENHQKEVHEFWEDL